jgi:hypothetical protein
MAARKSTARKSTTARKSRTASRNAAPATTTVNLRQEIVNGLAEKGLKAKTKDAPSKNYASILVDGKNIGYVFKQTKQGVRVLLAMQPGDLPKSIKGFKASGRGGAFGAMGGFNANNLSHAVEALALSATRQGEAAAAKKAAADEAKAKAKRIAASVKADEPKADEAPAPAAA